MHPQASRQIGGVLFYCIPHAIMLVSQLISHMPQTSIRLNAELWQALNAAIEQTGQSRTTLIQQALEQFLGGATARHDDVVIGAILDRLDRLEAAVFASPQVSQPCNPTATQSAKDLAILLNLDPSDTNLGVKLKRRGYTNIAPKGSKGIWVKY